MNKFERCERCPDEDTSVCDTCEEPEPEPMELTYTFVLGEGVCEIEGLHNDLDKVVKALGFGLVMSILESPDEICEHNFDEIQIPVVSPITEYSFEVGV
jgi:hypothetical protein